MKIPNRLLLPSFTSFTITRLCLAFTALTLFSGCSGSNSPEWQVVNYWATWCGPCRDEIPELNELATLNPEKIEVIGVNYDAPDEPKASEQIKEMGIEFANISLARAEEMGLSYPAILPTTYVLRDGEIVKVLKGPQTLESLQAVIEPAKTDS